MAIIEVRKLADYVGWYEEQTAKFQAQIEKRLLNIVEHGHFGTVRALGDELAELKFNNGSRIYFAMTDANEITLLLGGNKNGQDKDIKKARTLLAR